ncbi:hypothetical protein QFC22_006100 [Naganishia vaughanmartiniae]|uniref:Uncharacterized protein n=1 Tax=Naganishia vaughanmartiniae TaxID=1424756 RepID=A0ACC2WMQ6_9TREE|nr:hypothetical protein QFC22_006100 [Naganishia vaughanmartiniae]
MPYRRFLKFLEEGVIDDVLPGIRSLELDQGFEDPSDLYRIILQPKLSNLRSLAIVPSWPYSSNMTVPPARFFKFGLQLLPVPPAKPLRLTANEDDDGYSPSVNSDTDDDNENDDTGKQGVKRKRLDKLTLGLPLDLSTNAVSRQHLRLLRPKRLEITLLLRQHVELFEELADLLEGNTDELCIRFLASDQTHELCNPRDIVSSQMDRFGKVDIHLPTLTSSAMNRPYQGQQDRHTSFADHVINLIALDEERRKRYTVWVEQPDMPDGPMGPMGGLGAGWLKPRERVVWERPVEHADGTGSRDVLFVDDEYEQEQNELGQSSTKQGKQPATRAVHLETQAAGGAGAGHWERETHLKLLGGLVSLRLESKKH